MEKHLHRWADGYVNQSSFLKPNLVIWLTKSNVLIGGEGHYVELPLLGMYCSHTSRHFEKQSEDNPRYFSQGSYVLVKDKIRLQNRSRSAVNIIKHPTFIYEFYCSRVAGPPLRNVEPKLAFAVLKCGRLYGHLLCSTTLCKIDGRRAISIQMSPLKKKHIAAALCPLWK